MSLQAHSEASVLRSEQQGLSCESGSSLAADLAVDTTLARSTRFGTREPKLPCQEREPRSLAKSGVRVTVLSLLTYILNHFVRRKRLPAITESA